MAQQAPPSIDVSEIQLKVHSRYKVFGGNSKLRDHVNLLAVASNYGMLFVGNPYSAELQALILPDVLYAKEAGKSVRLRKVSLLGVPNTIACSADSSMLAINYTLQSYGVVDIFNVASFAAGDIQLLYSIRLPDENVFVLQLLWNPVLPTTIGVVLSNGTFAVYTLKEGGAIEMRTLQNQQVRCGCWSPKGKQIVLGFPNGKLQQFKPDLTAAKSIICPPDIHPGPFDTIAVHWLSTFQFIVCFHQHVEDSLLSLYIVNAPKGGNPTYINYNDICYSSAGPRAQQVQFTHVSQWNLLLVSSANGVEVGVLGSKEATDQPTWVHYMLLDEARIEMPLTDSSDETYPMGLTIDTSSVHQLTVREKKLGTMPMIHVLSTHGDLLSFNFLNLAPNTVDICSQPLPIDYALDKFSALNEDDITNQDITHTSSSSIERLEEKPVPNTTAPVIAPPVSSSFNIQASNVNFQSSTPFKAQAAQQTAPVQNLEAGLPSGGLLTNELMSKTTEAEASIGTSTGLKNMQQSTEVFKPLYTVSPVFAPPPKNAAGSGQTQKGSSITPSESAVLAQSQNLNINEANEVIKQMIAMQILSFDKEVKQLKSKLNITIGDDGNAMKGYSTRLIYLQDVIDQAKDRDFIIDVQDLRHSLTESYEMLSECRTKLEVYKNPDSESGIKRLTFFDCISQRQLKNLRSYLAINHAIMQQLEEQIDSQWSFYQDLVRRNSRTQMRVPCLDGIYQQMTKLKQLLTQQQTKLNYIKSVLKQNNMIYKPTEDCYKGKLGHENREITIESIADSILSLSLSRVADVKSTKLPDEKLNSIRNFVQQRGKVACIKPQRPNRKELTSEVILESKILIKKKESKEKKETLPKAFEIAAQANVSQALNSSQPKLVESITPKSLPNFIMSQKSTSITSQPKEGSTLSTLQPSKPTFTGFNFGGNSFANIAPVKESSQEPVKLFGNVVGNENKLNSVNAIGKTQAPKQETVEKNVSLPKADNSYIAKESLDALSSLSKAIPNISKASIDNYNSFLLQQFGNNFNDLTKNVTYNASFGNTAFTSETNTQMAYGLPAISSISQTAPFNLSTSQRPAFEKQNEPKNTSTFAGTEVPTTAMKNLVNAPQMKPVAKTRDQSKDMPPCNVTAADPVSTQLEAEEKFLKSINICKPTVKEADAPKPPGDPIRSTLNAFSFNLDGGNNSQTVKTPNPALALPVSSISATVATATVTTSMTTPATTTSPSIFGIPAATTVSSPATFISSFGTPVASAVSTSAETTTVTAAAITTPAEKPFSFVGAAAFKVPTFAAATPNTTNVPLNPNPTTVQATSTSSAFFSTISTTSPTTNIFSSESRETVKSPFANAADVSSPATTTTSTSIFANAAANSSSISGNIFGNNARFNSPTGSIFGGSAANAAPTSPNATVSIFGNNSANKTEAVSGANLFSTPAPANAASGGSIFNQSAFGQPNITAFATPEASAAVPASTPTASNFSFTGSLFRNTTSGNSTSGGSLFGNNALAAEAQPFGTPTVGGFSANTTPAATSPFSPFTQGGSVANTGFGSPTPQTNTFAKPVFGGAPTFGSPPVFGSQPSFGGAPTFGSPKGFNTFSTPNAAPFGGDAQKNNIFEALGSTDTGLSFGNLAQSTNAPQGAPKPIFGGSSFMNYRA